ncbi:hypothetical protein [Allorhodopirellula solitaria]|uniref:Secreted protein n=1 Tax=Allorhodopirellula solitaria TaxID=2527987 RepID=A0A5C5X0U0_9BACT|nr:hypothetical protein [Allorhodopirellula solitaria]TWT56566.1 hypothetical protein CA85_40990 [Allorhodopirellula solitaria]
MKRQISSRPYVGALALLSLSVALCIQTGCGNSDNSLSQDVSQSDIDSYQQQLEASQAKANAEEG